jgi:hypothetical protein
MPMKLFAAERASARHHIRLYCILIFILLSIGPVGSGQSSEVLDTDACNLNAHPKQFDKKHVRVRARIMRSTHGTAIFDLSKPSCGIGLWYAEDAEKNGMFLALDNAVLQERAKGVLGKKIIATFTGVLLEKSKHGHKPVLQAEKIEDLKLESEEH